MVLKGVIFNNFHFWPTQLMYLGCHFHHCLHHCILLYNTPYHMVDASEFICCLCIGELPHTFTFGNLYMWLIYGIRGACLLLEQYGNNMVN